MFGRTTNTIAVKSRSRYDLSFETRFRKVQIGKTKVNTPERVITAMLLSGVTNQPLKLPYSGKRIPEQHH